MNCVCCEASDDLMILNDEVMKLIGSEVKASKLLTYEYKTGMFSRMIVR
jgi:hypothetical protein